MCTSDFKGSIKPTVFAVKDMYQIFIPLDFEGIISVAVGDEIFYDDANGILRSNSFLHKVEIPMELLDTAKEYTVICRKMIDRKPYFPTSEEPFTTRFKFKPVTGDNINIYHIADAHNMEDAPIAAGKYFGENLDLLVLNGDIPNHSGELENFNSIYRIAFGVTKGEIPVVFSKGNHDTRGIHAEEFSDYTPTNNGKPYFTFRLGSLWGLVLDCGEDKLDGHEEYGNTVCFHNYRLKETRFIEEVINNAEKEYLAEGVKHRLVICHIPFIKQFAEPFNIEEELYCKWTKTVCENIKPELLLFGHTHKIGIHEPGGDFDYYGYQNCIAVVGAQPNTKENTFIGCGITLSDAEPKVIFTDEKLNIVNSHINRDNLKIHYKPQKGWINDPNGLVFFKGKYHVFYQHDPNNEVAGGGICWGHSATKDFLNWEQLPIALKPDKEYDSFGCWSGTAIVKDEILYIFYTSAKMSGENRIETVSIAYSEDGINFKKFADNPVIRNYPKEGGPDFRDPAVFEKNGIYYLILASGNPQDKAARLLLYKSADLLNWDYCGVLREWENHRFCECPSIVNFGNKNMLAVSVCKLDVVDGFIAHYFNLIYGEFNGKTFFPDVIASIDKGPDEYAGQIFNDDKGRTIIISWIPGWHWMGKLGRDIGCLSVPKEVKFENGKILCYPIEEFHRFLKDSDPAVKITDNGFIIERNINGPIEYKGEIRDLKILRDDYVLEVFVNGGEEVYTAVVL